MMTTTSACFPYNQSICAFFALCFRAVGDSGQFLRR